MKKSTVNLSAKKMMDMVKKGTLVLNSPIQRRKGQWSDLGKSLLFHSMLSDYIIPPLYLAKIVTGEDEKGNLVYTLEVVDGLQRITVVLDFINECYPLDDNTPNVIVDDEEVVLAGKYFPELPANVQEEIKRYQFLAYNLEDFSDEEIEEIFFRLNNGVALTKGQQSRSKMGTEVATFVNNMLEKDFFTKIAHFTPLQFRRAADQLCLIQAMCLMDVRYNNYELVSISENDMFNYASSLRNNYPEESQNRIKMAVDYLEDAFGENEKFIKKINVPMVIVLADKALKMEVQPGVFGEWLHDFAKRYTSGCPYSNACSSGSIKKDKTLKRIAIMEDDFEKFVSKNVSKSGKND